MVGNKYFKAKAKPTSGATQGGQKAGGGWQASQTTECAPTK